MAAKSFAARLARSRRFFSGFVAGAVVGAAGAGLTAWQFLRSQGTEAALAAREPGGSAEKALLGQFGFPLTGTETRCYTNHALSYDQSKRVPRWVLEHISKSKIMGAADRRNCKFKPDPNIPPAFSALNKDYVGSGWSRGHMAPAGNNKFSSKAMAETFYLSNIVPQNFDNNAGYWNRIEMYCRELTERFDDVWIVSGPLTLPQTGSDGKKIVSYQNSSADSSCGNLGDHFPAPCAISEAENYVTFVCEQPKAKIIYEKVFAESSLVTRCLGKTHLEDFHLEAFLFLQEQHSDQSRC
ncbi:nuclease EXOG, mitochondrial isoform X6 [Myotis daubentonii]|uniref:nuclease EXOG, mitochondrial isoform X6 n=1 Tax=Myotis daubentonii TaxID=98922 RepID=UPI002873EDE1|nr:nuclease EXOG, mitochondrial isoform X6 [Myotis daubentonii]